MPLADTAHCVVLSYVSPVLMWDHVP